MSMNGVHRMNVSCRISPTFYAYYYNIFHFRISQYFKIFMYVWLNNVMGG